MYLTLFLYLSTLHSVKVLPDKKEMKYALQREEKMFRHTYKHAYMPLLKHRETLRENLYKPFSVYITHKSSIYPESSLINDKKGKKLKITFYIKP